MSERVKKDRMSRLSKVWVIISVGFGFVSTAIAASIELAHQTDFLAAGCLTHVYPGLSNSKRQACLKKMTDRKYTHMYVYAYNENDYGGPGFDYYENPEQFRKILEDIRAAGIEPVVWLNPDDAPKNKKRSVSELKSRMANFIPVVDSVASSYCLGLELNEYWDFDKVNQLGRYLDGITEKKIAVHQTGGRWDYCKKSDWCDYMILQYGFGKDASSISEMTKKIIKDLGKPVVAGEYNDIGKSESNGRTLGDAAMKTGAVGFGNGGTPFASSGSPKVESPQAPEELRIFIE
jgi:hypothetical protein